MSFLNKIHSTDEVELSLTKTKSHFSDYCNGISVKELFLDLTNDVDAVAN